MSELDQVIPQDAKKAVLTVLAKQVALWVVVLAFLAGIVLAVVLGGNAEHKSSLLSTIVTTPLFVIQVAILAAVALAVNYAILWVRGRKAYDKLGPVGELQTVQGRVGTVDEKPGDAQALGLQFLANTILIAVVILSFFLMRAGA